METVYLEYEILQDQPGLLGDVASLLGLLDININTVASIEGNFRGFLLEIEDSEKKESLVKALSSISDLKISKFRPPELNDFLALKHGKKISWRKDGEIYNFYRTELELLLDLMSHFITGRSDVKLGLSGEPKVGKTETAIAAAVHANKEWRLLSTTLLRKIAVKKLSANLNSETVFIIDAITTFFRSSAEHVRFIRRFLSETEAPIIIEHPQIFVQETEYDFDCFDMVINLSSREDNGDNGDSSKYFQTFNSFDLS